MSISSLYDYPCGSEPAPPGSAFPEYPASWYLWGHSRDVAGRPVSRTLFGKRLVAWRLASGRPVILSARCSHFGADLGLGRVVNDRLQCAFHNWEYGADGRCAHIPALENAPPSARQTSWPVIERHGLLFVFNGPAPRFELPFFKDCDPQDFVPARPIKAALECSWHLIGANAFDVQHFRAAHDRRLVGEPIVTQPHPLARSAEGTFEVAGNGWRDQVTRRFAGNRVTMAITDWCGNLMFATATFRRTTSYGMVVTEPQGPGRVLVRVIVYVRRSRGVLAGVLADPVRREIRRYFIMRFLSEDAMRLHGAVYNPQGLVECDRQLIQYFRWLAEAASPMCDSSAAISKLVSRPRLIDRTEQSV